jgi:hypothetical protein
MARETESRLFMSTKSKGRKSQYVSRNTAERRGAILVCGTYDMARLRKTSMWLARERGNYASP